MQNQEAKITYNSPKTGKPQEVFFFSNTTLKPQWTTQKNIYSATNTCVT